MILCGADSGTGHNGVAHIGLCWDGTKGNSVLGCQSVSGRIYRVITNSECFCAVITVTDESETTWRQGESDTAPKPAPHFNGGADLEAQGKTGCMNCATSEEGRKRKEE